MSTRKELYKQSETVIIKRSQINFAPYNPKKHTKEKIVQIQKNIKRVGFLGGIIWNEITKNLVDGHKRIQVLDVIHKYKGDDTTDYEVKVEKISLDEKTEKEQNIFQTESRTELDSELIQSLIPEIDYTNAGLSLEDLNYYLPNLPIYDTPEFNEIEDDFNNLEKKTLEEREEEKQKRIEKIKEAKQATKNKMEEESEEDTFLVLSFSDSENKSYFLELLNKKPYEKYIKGEEVMHKMR